MQLFPRLLLPCVLSCICACAICATVCSAQDDPVATGPRPLSPSSTPSAWLRGVGADTGAIAARLHIVGATTDSANIMVRAIPLDANGNFIASADSWGLTLACIGAEGAASVATPTVVSGAWDITPVDVVVCIDHSLSSGDFAGTVARGLHGTMPTAFGGDSVRVQLFDEEQAYPEDPSASVPAPTGLASVYTAMYSALQSFPASPDRRRMVIVVTASDDQSSVVHTATDVFVRAQATNTTIHIVRMASSTHGYIYKYLAGSTGGVSVAVQDDRIDDIGSIVSQLVTASHVSVVMRTPLPSTAAGCDDLRVGVQYTNADGTTVTDSVTLPLTRRSFTVSNTIVATFPDDTESDVRKHYVTLASLSEKLLEDTTLHIELTGHTSLDASGDAQAKSVARAGIVSDLLVAYGVPQSRIRIRGAGSGRPLYYFLDSPEHRTYNNRVEMRILRADDLPFTVTVEQAVSEEAAARAVQRWKDRGFKSYFESVATADGPAYKVRLWGYATIAEAQAAATKVVKAYKVRAMVD